MNKYNKALALPNEVWEDVKGYEGLYKVSSMGRVKSLERIDCRGHLVKERILKLKKGRIGYFYVTLCKDGKQKNYFIHRLVAEAFLKPIPKKNFVNHLDEVKTSNHYSNLEYCTHKENCNYGTRNKRVAKAKSKPIQGVDPKSGKIVVEFPSTKEAGKNGYVQGNVSACCRGELKSHHGLIWRYK